MYDVSILDEHGRIQASCLIPSLSRPFCFTSLPHSVISQDISTNTTILKVRHIDSSLNGSWTCRHGRGKQQATVRYSHVSLKGCMYYLFSDEVAFRHILIKLTDEKQYIKGAYMEIIPFKYYTTGIIELTNGNSIEFKQITT